MGKLENEDAELITRWRERAILAALAVESPKALLLSRLQMSKYINKCGQLARDASKQRTPMSSPESEKKSSITCHG